MKYAISVLEYEITRIKTYSNEPISDTLNKIVDKLEKDINKFPEHLRIRQVPWKQ
jgi:hypothetical protein